MLVSSWSEFSTKARELPPPSPPRPFPSSKETKEVAAPAVGHLGEQPQEFRGSAPVLHPCAALLPYVLCLRQLG